MGLMSKFFTDPNQPNGGIIAQLLGLQPADTSAPMGPIPNPTAIAGMPSEPSSLLGDSPFGRALRSALVGLATSSNAKNFGTGLGAGVMGATQFNSQRDQDRIRRQLAGQQAQEFAYKQQDRQTEQAAAAKQQADWEALLPTLPPAIQQTARAMGPAFMDVWGKQQVEAAFPKPMQPGSAVAKAAADLKAGLIDQATFDAIKRKETYIPPQGSAEPRHSPRYYQAVDAGLTPGTPEFNTFLTEQGGENRINYITLVSPDGQQKTVNEYSPEAQDLTSHGWIERNPMTAPTGYAPGPVVDGKPTYEAVPGGPADVNTPTGAQRDKFVTSMQGLDNLESAVDQYAKRLTSTLDDGQPNPDYIAPSVSGSVIGLPNEKAAKEGTDYTALTIQAKNLFELGALSGPDYGLIQSTLQDPNTVKGYWLGAKGLKSQVDQVKIILKNARENLKKNNPTLAKTLNSQNPSAPSKVLKFDSQGNPIQ